jgi:hypothetical protein
VKDGEAVKLVLGNPRKFAKGCLGEVVKFVLDTRGIFKDGCFERFY